MSVLTLHQMVHTPTGSGAVIELDHRLADGRVGVLVRTYDPGWDVFDDVDWFEYRELEPADGTWNDLLCGNRTRRKEAP